MCVRLAAFPSGRIRTTEKRERRDSPDSAHQRRYNREREKERWVQLSVEKESPLLRLAGWEGGWMPRALSTGPMNTHTHTRHGARERDRETHSLTSRSWEKQKDGSKRMSKQSAFTRTHLSSASNTFFSLSLSGSELDEKASKAQAASSSPPSISNSEES